MSNPARMRQSTWDNIIIAISAAIVLMVAVTMDSWGMPQKWDAAIFGNLLPFAVTITGYRRWWARTVFWAALGICFVVHTAAIWFVFQYVLARTQTVGIIQWFPVAFVDTFVLIMVVKKVVEKITGKRQKVKFS